MTPLLYCASSGYGEFRSLEVLKQIHGKELYGRVEVCKVLLAAKADAAARDWCDATALAVRRLNANSDNPPPCSENRTALKLAIKNRNPDVVAFLRSIGAPE